MLLSSHHLPGFCKAAHVIPARTYYLDRAPSRKSFALPFLLNVNANEKVGSPKQLDDVIPGLREIKAEVPERTTFYGAREIGCKDPGGQVVTSQNSRSRRSTDAIHD